MRNLELHVFETDTDIDEAVQSGLLYPESLHGIECLSCSTEVGNTEAVGFTPFSYVIDDEDREWFVCLECSEPMLLGLASSTIYKPLEATYSNMLERELSDVDEF